MLGEREEGLVSNPGSGVIESEWLWFELSRKG